MNFLEKCDAVLNIDVPTIKWRAFVGANYKMNVACRLNATKDGLGVGIVIRDSNGIVWCFLYQYSPWWRFFPRTCSCNSSWVPLCV